MPATAWRRGGRGGGDARRTARGDSNSDGRDARSTTGRYARPWRLPAGPSRPDAHQLRRLPVQVTIQKQFPPQLDFQDPSDGLLVYTACLSAPMCPSQPGASSVSIHTPTTARFPGIGRMTESLWGSHSHSQARERSAMRTSARASACLGGLQPWAERSPVPQGRMVGCGRWESMTLYTRLARRRCGTMCTR